MIGLCETEKQESFVRHRLVTWLSVIWNENSSTFKHK